MTNSPRRFSRVLGAAVTISLAGSAVAQEVVREGTGPRRDALDAMELRAFPAELWDSLSEWGNGGPVSGESLDGKVVLVFTWSGWYPGAIRVLPQVQALAAAHPEDLVVVGVHNPRGFERAASAARTYKLSFPYALDADGAFRDALRVDQDPDFYVIDRAGQLRFADVATPSVQGAVERLLGESRQEAADLTSRLQTQAAEEDRAFRRSGAINQGVDLRELPEVPFPQPPATEYAFDARGQELAWPEQEDPNNNGFGQPAGPRALVMPDVGWAKMPAPPRAGRVTVAYFWHPDDRSSYEPILEPMNRVQNSKGRDVVVVGVLSPVSNQGGFGNQGPDAADIQRWNQTMRALAVERQLAHHLLFDPSGAIRSAAEGSTSGFRNNTTGAQAAIASSDGLVRWSGRAGSPEFFVALDQILKLDPGVKARRAAEQEFIKTRADR